MGSDYEKDLSIDGFTNETYNNPLAAAHPSSASNWPEKKGSPEDQILRNWEKSKLGISRTPEKGESLPIWTKLSSLIGHWSNYNRFVLDDSGYEKVKNQNPYNLIEDPKEENIYSVPSPKGIN